MKKTLMVLLLPLALAACAPAATDPNVEANMASVDVQYMQATTGSNMFEIMSSQLALQPGKSNSDAVKAYAQQMITDHQKAQGQLNTLAANKKVPLPAVLPPDLQVKVNTLSTLSGADFDTAYAKEQLLGHQLALSIQQNELQSGQDADAKAYASAQVPVVSMHLDMAKALPGATLPSP